jgi:hypothetical protein
MWRRETAGALAALAMAACGGGTGATMGNPAVAGGATPVDPEALWMDDAEVRVMEDACAGTSTVELVNVAVGQDAVVDSETFPPEQSCQRS